MRTKLKLVATVCVIAVASSTMSAPAAAFGFPSFGFPSFGFPFFKPPVFKPPVFKPPFKPPFHGHPHKPTPPSTPASNSTGGGGKTGNMTTGKIVVGCIFGSAFGLISAALAKGKAYNSKTVELTEQEVWTIALSCGLGTFPVIASFPRTN